MASKHGWRSLLLVPVGVFAAAGLWLAALAAAENDATVRAGGYGKPTCNNADQSYDTRITMAPPRKTDSRTAKIKFEPFYCEYPNLSSQPNGADMNFKCKLDAKKPKACSSPVSYKKLKRGKHKLGVRVIGWKGNPDKTAGDPTPAIVKWKVSG